MDEHGGAGVGMALEDVEPRGQGSEHQVQIYKEKERLKTMAKKKSQRVSKDQKQDKMFVSITEAS